MLEVLENKEALVELLEGRLRGLERPELRRGGLEEVFGKLKRTILSTWRRRWALMPQRSEVASKTSWKTITKAKAAQRILKKLFNHRKDAEKDVVINTPVKFMILEESIQQNTYFSYELWEEPSNVYIDMEPNLYMQPIIYMEPISVTYSRVLSSMRAWPLPQDCETPPRPPRQPPPVPAPPSRPPTPPTSSHLRGVGRLTSPLSLWSRSQEAQRRGSHPLSQNDLLNSLPFCSICSTFHCLCVTSL